MTQYFDPSPAVPSRPGRVTLALPDFTADLAVDRGVFSAGGVDTGTMELLRLDVPPAAGGDLLDLGCGYGPIAVTLARRNPALTVWAVDINERAVALTATNASDLSLANVRAVSPADVPAETRFSEIWSNPPIRIGKAALHELLTLWLGRLRPGGVARLVVQKHLGSDSLASWLGQLGFGVERMGSRKGFRLLEVRPSPPGPATKIPLGRP